MRFDLVLTFVSCFFSGERVILAESASAPGIPIIYRLEEERKSNPDKLNLDRYYNIFVMYNN